MKELQLASINDVLIVKVGTSVIADTLPNGSERLNRKHIQSLGQQLIELGDDGYDVITVTSASIAAGRERKQISGPRPQKNTGEGKRLLQAYSAIGWSPLVTSWQRAMHNKTVVPVQLTDHDLQDSTHQLEHDNALTSLKTLLELGTMPVINENDITATDEITFGDNDILAGILAAQIKLSGKFSNNVKLVLLTGEVDGIEDENKVVIPTIENIEKYTHVDNGTKSPNGTGGVSSKFAAAGTAALAGVETWYANGREENAIKRTLDGEIGTHFTAASRQQLAGSL